MSCIAICHNQDFRNEIKNNDQITPQEIKLILDLAFHPKHNIDQHPFQAWFIQKAQQMKAQKSPTNQDFIVSFSIALG